MPENQGAYRVVLDTSVWIHYLVRPGAAIRLIIEDYWVEGRIALLTAPELIHELEVVLTRPKIQQFVHAADTEELLDLVRRYTVMLPELGEIPPITRDPKDDKFVACAVAGGADFLITLDKDILVLGDLGGVQMMTPFSFVKHIGSG